MPNFTSQVGVVTGGARGIGFGVAVGLGLGGAAHIAIVDVSASDLSEASNALKQQGFNVSTHQVDVTNLAQVQVSSTPMGGDPQIRVTTGVHRLSPGPVWQG